MKLRPRITLKTDNEVTIGIAFKPVVDHAPYTITLQIWTPGDGGVGVELNRHEVSYLRDVLDHWLMGEYDFE